MFSVMKRLRIFVLPALQSQIRLSLYRSAGQPFSPYQSVSEQHFFGELIPSNLLLSCFGCELGWAISQGAVINDVLAESEAAKRHGK